MASHRLSATGILLCVWFGAALASSVYCLATEAPKALEIAFFGVLIALGIGLLALQFIPFKARTNIHVLVIAVSLPLYGYEGWVRESSDDERFDPRSKYEVTMDLREGGVNAYPAAHPYLFRNKRLEIAGGKVLPLGGIPSVTTVFCSEGGPYIIYESDEFGFRNPPGTWGQKIEAAFLGDSYAEGACVEDEHIAGIVRARFPGTLNLGVSGTGPLNQLGQIREYLSEVKPRYVLWFYYEGNDLIVIRGKHPDQDADLRLESELEILTSYLDPDFEQGLYERRNAVRAAMLHFVERKLERKARKERHKIAGLDFATIFQGAVDFLTLHDILADIVELSGREKKLEKWYKKEALEEARKLLPLYEEILRVARDEIAAWGGRLVMVNLPDRESGLGKRHPLKSDLMDLWAGLGIDVIDPTSNFVQHETPETLRYRHYSEEGYGIVALAVLKYLEGAHLDEKGSHGAVDSQASDSPEEPRES